MPPALARSGEVIHGELIFKGLIVTGFWLTEWLATASAHDKSALFETITPQVASGSLQLAVDARYGIDDIKEAVAHSMAGRRNGKVILYPNR